MNTAKFVALIAMCAAVGGCKDKDVDASEDEAVEGEACANEGEDGAACAEGLACEPAGAPGDEQYVCGAPLELRGSVFDALTEASVEGALVSALDETGAPVSDVAVSDAEGNYVLTVSARRDDDGIIVDALKWTLFATAQDYQPFPAGVRPAIPINAVDASEETGEDDKVLQVIDNPSTDVALLILPEGERTGRTVSGTVEGDSGLGTLVVAEGGGTSPYTIADASGHYTLFNVPDSGVTIVGYRRGLSLRAATPDGGEQSEVNLEVVDEGEDALPTVSGSVNIVNAGGGSQTSVVLVPVSIYNEALERGPVPFGLRAPDPPLSPDVVGGFAIRGVPPGRYKVLAAFENDGLVRDPDEGISGTDIQEITVADASVEVAAGFKVTAALEVVSPGADVPEIVSGTPTFVFADDSSEDGYEIVVFDAFGNRVWEKLDVPRVTGDNNVTVPYEGPALIGGMYYQFRALSFKDGSPISRTEDLRGVFVGP